MTCPPGAKVTRFAPSPTGFLHIGGVFTATIDADVARQSGGVYLLRLEDTDQARIVEGAEAQFAEAFAYFSIEPDEHGQVGQYGPYAQSARAQTYLTYVRELLRQGRAYPCFATKEELAEITARQRAAGALPGYYGTWAIWRDAEPEQVAKRLAAGDPYVVRFRSPGASGVRVSFTDAIRGELTADDNRNDVVILKSSDTEPRLPTYHFAHAVDDHLMRVNLVIRGEEWLSSVPLHLQLFDALGFERVQYAHIALLMKQDGGSRRKLSKRRDPEATVSFYIEQGYPAPAVQYYLRGLANGAAGRAAAARGAGRADPARRVRHRGPAGRHGQARRRLRRLTSPPCPASRSSPGAAVGRRVRPGPGVGPAAEPELALRALAIERVGTDNPRKDLRKWADFRRVYGFFFPPIFEPVTDPADPRFGGLDPEAGAGAWPRVRRRLQPGARARTSPGSTRSGTLAGTSGSRRSQKVYKKDPAAYKGSIREASQVIRVLLTGAPRSPDLAQVAARPRPRRDPPPHPRRPRLCCL